MSSSPIVTIFGGGGFVGSYITQAMAKAGWRVRVACRRPNEVLHVRTYGVVGQVDVMQANIRDEASTAAAIAGADAVINCVGILQELGRQKFDSVQADGAARIARLAAEAGVGQFLHVSAIGADAESESDYARTKAEAEAAVISAFPDAIILRPSIVFGAEDEFFNRFAAMARMSPILPVIGAKTLFQPVYVADIAEAAVAAISSNSAGVFELGGPDVESFEALMQRLLGVIRRRRLLLALPWWLAGMKAAVFDLIPVVTLGLIPNGLFTKDQVKLLKTDNVVSPDAQGFAALGIKPKDMDAVLETYLYSYRPSGQFSAIKESAQNLR